jgi:ubiquinone/menaquinone biosynthesis C-methylase UbiE
VPEAKEGADMKRLMQPELLDVVGAVEAGELESSLKEVWAVNRYMGGNPALFRHLRRLMAIADGDGRTVRILDIATGLADIPVAIVRWAEKRGMDVSVTGIDIHPQIAALAGSRTKAYPAVRIERADGRSLPYADGSFDLTLCNLALHHLDDEGAIRMLREMRRVSRIGWVVTDLERHPAAYGAARLLARLVWRSPVTRHDGPLSVLRSYTAREAGELVQRAGVTANVYRHFPFRLAIVGHA